MDKRRDQDAREKNNKNDQGIEVGEIVPNPPSRFTLCIWILISAELLIKLVPVGVHVISLFNDDECYGKMEKVIALYLVVIAYFLFTVTSIVVMGMLGCGVSTLFSLLEIPIWFPFWRCPFWRCKFEYILLYTLSMYVFFLDIPLLMLTCLEVAVFILLSQQLSMAEACVFVLCTGLRVVILQPFSMLIRRGKAGRTRFGFVTMILQWIAFAGMVYLLVLFIKNDGVCLRSEGCDVCADGLPPGVDGLCSSTARSRGYLLCG